MWNYCKKTHHLIGFLDILIFNAMVNAFKIIKVTFDNVRYFSLPLPNICNALPLPLL